MTVVEERDTVKVIVMRETDVNGYFIESESSEEEYYSDVTCYRCGRKGHIKTDCYASKHVRGYNLT